MFRLEVPYTEKNEAKVLGARWNSDLRTWYVPDGVDRALFERWVVPNSLSITAAPVAARATRKHPLFVDLIPRSAWFSNLRSELTAAEWESVKKATYQAAGYCCEACSGQGPNHPVECHERWEFDLAKKVQTLLGTVALCPDCHEATHFGLADVRGRGQAARKHLQAVNCWSDSETTLHIRAAGELWKLRSTVKWTLDARWLVSFVPLGEESSRKIMSHAAGLLERTVLPSQQETISTYTPRGRRRGQP